MAEELARRLQGEFCSICTLIEQLRCYPAPLRLLLHFVPHATWPNPPLPSGTSAIIAAATSAEENSAEITSSDIAERIRGCSCEQIRQISWLGSSLLPSDDDLDYFSFDPIQQDQKPQITRQVQVQVQQEQEQEHDFSTNVMPGTPWEPVRTIVQIYLLKELLANFTAVQLLFRVVASVDPPQQRQTLSSLSQLLLHDISHQTIEKVKSEISSLVDPTSNCNDYEVKAISIIEKYIPLRSELFHLYRPLFSLLSLTNEESLIVVDSLPKMVPVQLFQVVRLRALSPTDILELQSLLWPQNQNQNQNQHQQHMIKRDPEQQQQQVLLPITDSNNSNVEMQQSQQEQQNNQQCQNNNNNTNNQQQQQQNSSSPLQLSIIEQPPERCVYKRNVKPGPTVVISGRGESPSDLNGLAVVPLLFRCDTNSDETHSLSGNAPADVTPSRVVVFRKLKVLVTSHQLSETLFVFRFELRRYRAGPGSEFEILHSVTSTPVNVVSHSTQLRTAAIAASNNNQQLQQQMQQQQTQQQTQQQQQQQQIQQQPILSSPQQSMNITKPNVIEIVPCNGIINGGTRVAILGSNFIDSPSIRIRFGDNGPDVVPLFYGPGTLICNTPPKSINSNGMVVSVRVCNTPGQFSDSAASFTYENANQTTEMQVKQTTAIQQTQQIHSPTTSTQPQTNQNQTQTTTTMVMTNAETICEPVVCGDIEGLRSRIKTLQSQQQQQTHGSGNVSLKVVDEVDPRGFAAMHYAAVSTLITGIELMDILIQMGGASVNVRDINGNTPLHWASATGNETAIIRLLLHGASPQLQNYDGDTPLHSAAGTNLKGSSACCSALIAAGAPVNAQEGPKSETPLHRAVAINNISTVQALLEHGASVLTIDEDGDTPLHTAAANGARNVIRALISAGADPNAKNADLETPLQIAASLGDYQLIELLISVGSDPNQVSPSLQQQVFSSSSSSFSTSLTSQTNQNNTMTGRRRSKSVVVEASAMKVAMSAYSRRRKRRSGTLTTTSFDETSFVAPFKFNFSNHQQQQQQQQQLPMSISQPALPMI